MNKVMANEIQLELEGLERQGVIICLGEFAENCRNVISRMNVRENNEYMRDYIFEGGVLRELRFDRVMC